MSWKDFLYYRKGTKLGIILLLILIVLSLILIELADRRKTTEIFLVQNDSIIQEFDTFRRSLKKRELYQSEPNHIQAKYKEDRTDKKFSSNANAIKSADYNKFDSISVSNINTDTYPKTIKLSPGQTISLNETDTSEWKKLPGIGSSYSSRIVKYRNLLGGYVRKEQLTEVYGVDNELFLKIIPYINEDSVCVKLKINTLEFRELLRHPYLNYKQVKAIVNLRSKKGDIVSINELAMLNEFNSDDIFRLEPYLEF